MKKISRDDCIFGRLLLYIDVSDVAHSKRCVMNNYGIMCSDDLWMRLIKIGFSNSHCPTLDEACYWLRRVHNLHISVRYLDTYDWTYDIAKIGWSRQYHRQLTYESDTKAQMEAIVHCCNIIENGYISVMF